jgi:hypothetical protein
MKRLIVMTALIVTLWHGGVAGASTAGESYLCVTDMATGFGFDKGRRQWHRANLRDERKYLVSKPRQPRMLGRWRKSGRLTRSSSVKGILPNLVSCSAMDLVTSV